MKKWLFRILFLITAVGALFCFTGFDVTCDGEFQGLSCNIDSCNSCDSCDSSCRHSYKVIEDTESTCGETGYIKRECIKCGHVDTEYKQRPPHNTVFTLHRGTCDKYGGDTSKYAWYDEERCTECDTVVYSYYYYKKSSGVHLYDEGKVVSEDENGCGQMVYTCLICGKEEFSYFHSENSPQMKACNEAMESKDCNRYYNTCELCKKIVTAIKHNYSVEEILVSPTETEYGLARKVCSHIKYSGYCPYANGEYYYLIPPYGVQS